MKKTLLTLSILTLAFCNFSQTVSSLAGSGVEDFIDGQGAAASFAGPHDVAVDASGNIYVADFKNNVIRKITSSGLVTTFAGTGVTGSADGNAAAASFNNPTGVEFDSNGNLFVVDYGNNKIRKIDVNGNVTTFAGSGTFGGADGSGINASFGGPVGICIDSNNKIYVADQTGGKIRSIDINGNVTTLAGTGGTGNSNTQGAVTFYYPYDVCVDANNQFLYIADQGNNLIRRIELADTTTTTFAGTGGASSTDGSLSTATFNIPLSIAVNSEGDLIVADYGGNKIRKITISTGNVSTYAGVGTQGNEDGAALTARFIAPIGVAIGPDDMVYVADYGNNKIRQIDKGASFISESRMNDFELNLYPNPTSGSVTITTFETIKTIEIFNISGELVQVENRKTFTVNTLPNGIYIALLSTENGIATSKFIKE